MPLKLTASSAVLSSRNSEEQCAANGRPSLPPRPLMALQQFKRNESSILVRVIDRVVYFYRRNLQLDGQFIFLNF